MSFKTANELGKLLVRLRLINQTQLDECQVRLAPRNNQPEALLRILESKNYLTSHQISQLSKGKTDLLVLGDYKIMYRNASGSFARVYRACSIKDGRMVGLKVLRERWSNDKHTVKQFEREARVCMKLKHRNIVPIYEVGSENGKHFFTMEFVEGGNLGDFINIRKKIEPAEASRYLCDMAEGLQYALNMGITHRDLKMSNVLMSTSGVAKLVDFGLAGTENVAWASSGETPQHALEYATLEKWTDAPVNDPRTDLYFLGTIFYELLTGLPPYTRTRSRDERKAITRYKNIRPIRDLEPNIPESVEAIVERLLQINPNLRYQRPNDVLKDLREAISALGNQAEASPSDSQIPTNGKSESSQNQLPTVMCVETRLKQQNQLRKYLSKRGFRVLVLTDIDRALGRLESNPPDCIVLMGDSIGDDVFDAYKTAHQLGAAAASSTVSIVVLAERQSHLQSDLEQSHTARVLVQPITLRDLRREIHYAFQRRIKDQRQAQSASGDA